MDRNTKLGAPVSIIDLRNDPSAAEASLNRVKVGVMGCGYWGPQLIRNLSSSPDVELSYVADIRAERRQFVAAEYPHVRTVADHREIIDSDVDAVVLATPIHTHYRLAREALLAGKHVLIEKPMATSVIEAAELVRLAEERGLTLMVGHTFVYNPAVRALRRIVRSGELGKLHYADCARLNLGLFQPRASVLWDLGPHDISILLYILDRMPVSVSCRGRDCVYAGLIDVAHMDVEFDGGFVAQVRLSWLDPAKVRRTTVVGDSKMVVYNESATEKLRIYDKGVVTSVDPAVFQASYRYGDITSPHIEWREPLRWECQHFVSCVRSGERPDSCGRVGLTVVAVLEAAERSLQQGGRIEQIEPPFPVESPLG